MYVRGVFLLKCDKSYNRTAYRLTSLLSLTFLADLISGSFSLKLPTLYLLCLPCYSRAVAAIYSYPLQKSEYGQREGQIIAALAKGNKRFKFIKTTTNQFYWVNTLSKSKI